MGVALSTFPGDGTMAPLGRHSEPGPHRRVLAGPAPGEEGGALLLPHKTTWRCGGAYSGELGTRGKMDWVHTKKVTEFSKM